VNGFTHRFLRAALVALGLVLLLGAVSQFALRGLPRDVMPIADPIDFLAFDCGAKVAVTRADPYLTEPLRSCERAALAESGLKIIPNFVVPAPLPPYALAALAPLALLTFRDASALWFALSLLAVGATMVMLRRLTGVPLLIVAVVVLAADGLASVPIGQVVPVLLCALCGAALALRAERPRLAALLTLPLLLEPHVGLPAAIALFVWEPRARRSLLAGAAFVVLLTLAGGVERNVEYLRVVLPEQALGEGLEFGGQYSLSALLAVVGVAPGLALAAGSASYLLVAAGGIALAGRVGAALHDRATLLLLPPAFAVMGGTYVHVHQMAFALPLLFLLLSRRPSLRALTVIALIGLAVPWETVSEIPGLGPSHVRAASHVDVRAAMARVSSGSLPAERSWGVWVRSGERDSRTDWQRFLCKLPTWFGLGLLAIATLIVARERDGTRGRPRTVSEASLRAAPRSA